MRKKYTSTMTGEEMRYLRQQLGRTVVSLAEEFEKSPRSWINMENNTHVVPFEIEVGLRLLAGDAGIPDYPHKQTRLTARHLSAFRRKYRLSQGQAAYAAGKSLSTWQRWETGKTKIPASLIYTLRAYVKNLQEE